MLGDKQRAELKRKLADMMEPALLASLNRFSLNYGALRTEYVALLAFIDKEL